MNTSPSNIFYILLLLERYHQNCQAVSAATTLIIVTFIAIFGQTLDMLVVSGTQP